MDTQKSWPPLSQEEFNKSSYLLHRAVQIVGKVMLQLPFEPHWASVAMPLSARGVTSGLIPYQERAFSLDFDFIDHQICCQTSDGGKEMVKLESMSVAELYEKIGRMLEQLDLPFTINPKPQEVSLAIAFDEDHEKRLYDEDVVQRWWAILLRTYKVLLTYHAQFYGITPKIGLFWGTLDLRDARYKGLHLPAKGNFIARNAMDDVQFEVGWSSSNEKYPTPSFFAFPYPKPDGYEKALLQPAAAKWVPAIQEFVLDYEDLLKSADPEADLLAFFTSTYAAMGWDASLSCSGTPI